MSYAIIDKKTNEVIEGGFSTENEALDALIDSAPDEKELDFYDVVFVSDNKEAPVQDTPVVQADKPTTPEERSKFNRVPFGLGEQYAGVFPSLTESHMKDKGIGDNLRSLGNDILSLPGRVVSTSFGHETTGTFKSPMERLSGSEEERSGFWKDLGTRSDETNNVGGKFLRDPINGALTLASGGMGTIVREGGALGARLLPNAPKIGKMIGTALTGAAEGAAVDAADKVMKDKPFNKQDMVVSSVLGAGGESLGGFVNYLLNQRGKEFVLSLGSAAQLGNTDRKLSWEEFINRYRNDEGYRKVVDLLAKRQLEGRNLLPVNDRGKNLTGDLETAEGLARGVLAKDKNMNLAVKKDIAPGETAEAANDIRKSEILGMDDANLASYQNKTIFNGSKINDRDREYPHIVGDTDNFHEASLNKGRKENFQQTNQEYQLNRFAEKYNGISKMVDGANTRPGGMTADEASFLDELFKESNYDVGVVSSWNGKTAVDTDKFALNKNNFSNEFINERLIPFIESHNVDGLSAEFKNEVSRLSGASVSNGRNVINGIWKELDGKRNSIERAFAYSKDAPYKVRKEFEYAVDKFADELSAYAEMRVGKPGINAEGVPYVTGKENMKKYAYSYLAKVQETLEKHLALSPEDIVSLYGLATNVNDTVVQQAIINLLKNLHVNKSVINEFNQIGGRYAMINKARTRMKNNTREDNPLKGTIMAPIYPQEGINLGNAVSYGLTKPTVDLKTGQVVQSNHNPGRMARSGLYLLGRPLYESNK